MATTIKGPAIFLAQFAGDTAPFDTLDNICKWAAGLGYEGVQIPTWVSSFIDLEKAATSKTYADELKGIVNSHGLEITELSTHLQGQLVAVHPAYDEAFDGFASPEVRGNPKARQAWAVEQMMMAAKASKRLGLKASVTFPGALAWPFMYPWPQRPAGLVETAFEELGRRWKPILDAYEDADCDVCYEIHPGEDIHDGAKNDLLIAALAAISLILLIMMFITRSLVAAMVIVGTVVLSLGASFGLSVLVWQSIFGIQLYWIVLALAIILLLAVGADYNLLLISRFQEEIGAGLKTGVIRAMAGTGRVVTAAGLVFAATMSSFIFSDLIVLGQIGVDLAFLIDFLRRVERQRLLRLQDGIGLLRRAAFDAGDGIFLAKIVKAGAALRAGPLGAPFRFHHGYETPWKGIGKAPPNHRHESETPGALP